MATTVGERIRIRRAELKITQKQLADMTGLSQGHISKLENNTYDISISQLRKIADVLEVNTYYLIDNAIMPTKDEIRDGHDVLDDLELLNDKMNFNDMLDLISVCKHTTFFKTPHYKPVLLLWKARALISLRRFKEGLACCLAALKNSQFLRDEVVIELYNAMGTAYQHLARIDDAMMYLQRAYELLVSTPQKVNPRVKRVVLYNIGYAYNSRQEYGIASKYLDQAQKVLETEMSSYMRVMGQILHVRGIHAYMSGDLKMALELTNNSLRYYNAIGHVYGSSESMNNLAFITKELGNVEESERRYRELIELFRKHPDKVSKSAIEEVRKEGYDV